MCLTCFSLATLKPFMFTFLKRGGVDVFSVSISCCLFALQCSEYQWTANMYTSRGQTCRLSFIHGVEGKLTYILRADLCQSNFALSHVTCT